MNTWAALAYGGGQHRRPLPRRAARRPPDRPGAGRRGQRTRLCLLRHQPPDLVRRYPRQGPQDREGRAHRRLRAPPGLLQAGEGPHRCLEALRRLLDRVERPPFRIPALVSQAPGRDQQVDRHERLDPRRDRRLSALVDRAPQLVRDRFPDVPRAGQQAAQQYKRTTEHASWIMEAQETGRVYRGHFNVRNNGIIRNLPADAIIESPGFR